MWFAFLFLGPCGLDCLNGFRTRTTGQLRPKAILGTSLSINAVVSSIRIGDPLIPTDGSDPGCGFIETLLRLLQYRILAVDIKFDTDSSSKCFAHKKSTPECRTKVKFFRPAGRFLSSPWRDRQAFLERTLMTVRYHQAEHGTRLIPEYVCQKDRIEHATEETCQHILGAGLDATIADLLLAQMTPFTLDTALQVYKELHAQVQAAQRLRDQQVERARYAAELAQRRFVRVDPENRLAASVLEAEWNAHLHEYTQIQEEIQKQQEQEQRHLNALERQAITNLVEDFPRVWRDERTSDRDRKRTMRLLLEDVTLRKDEVITAQLRFPGGATQTVTLPISQGRRSAQEIITLMDQLLDEYPDAEGAEQLNQRGWRTYEGKLFHATRVLSERALQPLEEPWSLAPGTRLLICH